MTEIAKPGIFVLVVDDDEVMRELLSALLEAAGHRTLSADSASAGLGIVRAEADALDVVLTDLRMPETDAVEMLRGLRGAMSARMRLIGMSGSEADAAELELLDGFLLKPFSVEEFVAAVERALEGGRKAAPVSANVSKRDATVLDEAIYARMAKSLPPVALRQMYELTLDDVRHRAQTIAEAAAAGDATTCMSEAHAMKGGCGMVGAVELRAIAAEIEAGSPVDTPMLEEIAAALERLRRMLDTLT